jgi:hypothetical protein
MSRAVRAIAEGLWMVLCAPVLVAAVTLVTLATAVPFGLVLGTRLQTALAAQQPVSEGSTEIDPEWWMEYRQHAKGLEATFTPTIIGFAAPLDNLSALLDASPRPLALAVPVVASGVVWGFLWGGVIHRFARGYRVGLREFVSAGLRHTPRLVLVSVAAALVYLLLYLTLHAWLFGPIYERLAARASSERDAFLWRVVLYAAFGAVLIGVSLIVDYTRVSLVSSRVPTVGGAIFSSARFVRGHLPSVLTLYLCTGTLFVALLAAYGTSETYSGTRLGGWRAVLIGQAYIVARLAIRLMLAASEVRLVQQVKGGRDGVAFAG